MTETLLPLQLTIVNYSIRQLPARPPISAEFPYLRVCFSRTYRGFVLWEPGDTEFSRNRGSCCTYSSSQSAVAHETSKWVAVKSPRIRILFSPMRSKKCTCPSTKICCAILFQKCEARMQILGASAMLLRLLYLQSSDVQNAKCSRAEAPYRGWKLIVKTQQQMLRS